MRLCDVGARESAGLMFRLCFSLTKVVFEECQKAASASFLLPVHGSFY